MGWPLCLGKSSSSKILQPTVLAAFHKLVLGNSNWLLWRENSTPTPAGALPCPRAPRLVSSKILSRETDKCEQGWYYLKVQNIVLVCSFLNALQFDIEKAPEKWIFQWLPQGASVYWFFLKIWIGNIVFHLTPHEQISQVTRKQTRMQQP